MPATYKMLGSVVAPPNGNPTTVYQPGRGKTAIIGKIIIASTWPDREREGYHHVTTFNNGLVEHKNQQNRTYYGYPPGVDVDTSRGYRNKAIIAATGIPSSSGLAHMLIDAHNKGSWAGTYSMFKIDIGTTPIAQPTLAPRTDQVLEFNQGVPIGVNEVLMVTNGLTDLSTQRSGDFQANQYTKKYPFDDLLRDHRARACSVRVTVFGQEITV